MFFYRLYLYSVVPISSLITHPPNSLVDNKFTRTCIHSPQTSELTPAEVDSAVDVIAQTQTQSQSQTVGGEIDKFDETDETDEVDEKDGLDGLKGLERQRKGRGRGTIDLSQIDHVHLDSRQTRAACRYVYVG